VPVGEFSGRRPSVVVDQNIGVGKSIGNLTAVLAAEEVRVGAVGVGCSKVRGGVCSRLVAKQSPSGAHQPMIAGQ
jgi:hypothetical protein